jgi:hypothetical protein
MIQNEQRYVSVASDTNKAQWSTQVQADRRGYRVVHVDAVTHSIGA